MSNDQTIQDGRTESNSSEPLEGFAKVVEGFTDHLKKNVGEQEVSGVMGAIGQLISNHIANANSGDQHRPQQLVDHFAQTVREISVSSENTAPARDQQPSQTASSRQAARYRYENELQTLRSMGFQDEARCRDILEQSNGDMFLAVDFLHAMQDLPN